MDLKGKFVISGLNQQGCLRHWISRAASGSESAVPPQALNQGGKKVPESHRGRRAQPAAG